MKARAVSTVLLILLVMVFSIQNYKIVEIKLLFWQLEISRVLLIYIMLFTGMAIGWMARTMVKFSR